MEDVRNDQSEIQRQWNGAAPYWKKWNEKFVEQSRAATELAVASAEVKPGMRTLDLASGTGEPALSMAKAVGPQGRIVATDLTLAMLQAAREKAAVLHQNNIHFGVSQAENLPFRDAGFDRVTCRFGVMFFLDIAKALAEIRRVLRPEGRISFVVWGPFDENPWFSVPLKPFLKHVQMPEPALDSPGPFRFADESKLAAALEEGGFQNVQATKRRVQWPWPGPAEEAWEAKSELSAPFKKLIAALPRDKEKEVLREVLRGIREFGSGERVEFPATLIAATASV